MPRRRPLLLRLTENDASKSERNNERRRRRVSVLLQKRRVDRKLLSASLRLDPSRISDQMVRVRYSYALGYDWLITDNSHRWSSTREDSCMA